MQFLHLLKEVQLPHGPGGYVEVCETCEKRAGVVGQTMEESTVHEHAAVQPANVIGRRLSDLGGGHVDETSVRRQQRRRKDSTVKDKNGRRGDVPLSAAEHGEVGGHAASHAQEADENRIRHGGCWLLLFEEAFERVQDGGG